MLLVLSGIIKPLQILYLYVRISVSDRKAHLSFNPLFSSDYLEFPSFATCSLFAYNSLHALQPTQKETPEFHFCFLYG